MKERTKPVEKRRTSVLFKVMINMMDDRSDEQKKQEIRQLYIHKSLQVKAVST